MRAMPWRAHLPVGTSASPVHAVHLPEEAAADCAAASSAVRIVAPDLPVLGVALFPLKVSRAEQECMACSPNTGPPGMLVLWEVKERRGGPIDEEIPVQPGAGSLRPGAGQKGRSREGKVADREERESLAGPPMGRCKLQNNGRSMRNMEPVSEDSGSVEDVHDLRLMALLHELVRKKGNRGAAQALGIDPRKVASRKKMGGCHGG